MIRLMRHSWILAMYQNSHGISAPHVLHPVKIVGWDSVPVEGNGDVGYWIVANSWGYAWGGLGGFFRVRMSSDMPELGAWIATDVSWPVISTSSPQPASDLAESSSYSFLINHILRKFRISITFPGNNFHPNDVWNHQKHTIILFSL